MQVYTRTGDKGKTSVIGGRVDKDDIRVEAYGTTDELNGFVGQTISEMDDAKFHDLKADLLEIQHELFDCGSDLALLIKDTPAVESAPGSAAGSAPKSEPEYKVTSEMVDRLEAWIDKYDAETEDITRFILPGGTTISSLLHVCRTVCRRAERRIVSLMKHDHINDEVLRYMNRLSDLFFVLARVANARLGQKDVEYVRSAEVFRIKKK